MRHRHGHQLLCHRADRARVWCDASSPWPRNPKADLPEWAAPFRETGRAGRAVALALGRRWDDFPKAVLAVTAICRCWSGSLTRPLSTPHPRSNRRRARAAGRSSHAIRHAIPATPEPVRAVCRCRRPDLRYHAARGSRACGLLTQGDPDALYPCKPGSAGGSGSDRVLKKGTSCIPTQSKAVEKRASRQRARPSPKSGRSRREHMRIEPLATLPQFSTAC